MKITIETDSTTCTIEDESVFADALFDMFTRAYLGVGFFQRNLEDAMIIYLQEKNYKIKHGRTKGNGE